MSQYGLLGRSLQHSYSPIIHKHFGTWPYALFEKEPNEIEAFLRFGRWDGLNVTIPYKKSVIPFCQKLSPIAQELGAVNTLVKLRNGDIYGDNTDVFGFSSTCQRMKINFDRKKALVLGSGGASATVQWVLRQLGATVTVVSRQGPVHYGNISQHIDASIIVNTTPVGMYPNSDDCLVALESFPNLEAVIDLIYNPVNTKLILQAQSLGIPSSSGLYMLVAQAAKSSFLFSGSEITPEQIDQTYAALAAETKNLVLVGMPGCGKSTIGRVVAQSLSRPFFDSDEEIEKLTGMPASLYLRSYGEDAFRVVEAKVLKRLGAMSGIVIATGGGCVVCPANNFYLRQNGTVIWLQRELSQLSCHNRPLSLEHGITNLFAQRAPLYQLFSDLTIHNNASPEIVCKAIVEVLGK